jgi:hypothetical protein
VGKDVQGQGDGGGVDGHGPDFDKRKQYNEKVAPLLNQLQQACRDAGHLPRHLRRLRPGLRGDTTWTPGSLVKLEQHPAQLPRGGRGHQARRPRGGAPGQGGPEGRPGRARCLTCPPPPSLSRALICAASWALPQVAEDNPYSEQGTSAHRYLELVGLGTAPEAALAQVTEGHRLACSSIDLDGLPLGGPYAPEVTYAYDVDSRVVRWLGNGLNRRYPPPGPAEVIGTADVVGVHEGDHVEIWDWKFGWGHDKHTPPAKENLQIKMLALAAARVAGVDEAVAGLIYLRDDGTSRRESIHLDAFGLVEVEDQLSEMARKVRSVQELVARGETPSVKVGDHCHYCDAKLACPAFGQLLQRALEPAGTLEEEFRRNLTPSRAAEAYVLFKQLKTLTDALNRAIWGFAAHSPIELGNGLVLGETSTEREAVSGPVAHQVLTKLFGRDVADKAVELDASKASIRRALRGVAQDTKRKLAHLEREVLAEVSKAGGLTVKVSSGVKEYRAGDAKPAANEAPPEPGPEEAHG